jgi:excisionase family DNA binding protein
MLGSAHEQQDMPMPSEIPAIARSPEQDRISREPIAYDLDAAAEVTGRSKPRIRKAIKSGELAARRDGRRLIIERDELRRWVRSLPLASSK